MPSRICVSEFVSCVQAGKYVEAIRDFYAETARMKENHGEPRVGRENLIRHEFWRDCSGCAPNASGRFSLMVILSPLTGYSR
jgi:hypothetical protein